MPSLNQADFLEAGVRSVLQQDYPNLELIVADGMSSDGSIDILSCLQSEFKRRLKWFSSKDSGAAMAINNAISISNGEILGWLNSDDLYAQGAVSSAITHFQRHPSNQFIYGRASHIDYEGNIIDAYPTLPPSTSIDHFADGNFVCQPTVFMRREALQNVGFLDENIHTAFDFDLFLRFFKRYPRDIGFIRRVQAYSRLHTTCMTKLLRRQVALDGMYVVKKELGVVPEHWFLTHIEEIFAVYPFQLDSVPLKKIVESFLKDSQNYYSPDVLKSIILRLQMDHRLRLSIPNSFVTVQPDGWVSGTLLVKYRWDDAKVSALLLHCKASWPIAGKFCLKVISSSGVIESININVPCDFTLRLELPLLQKSGLIIWRIIPDRSFIPAKYDKNSNDMRRLSFQVLDFQIES